MARKTERASLTLSEEQRRELETLARSRTAARRKVERAEILLRYAEGTPILQIGNLLGVSRPTIYKCIDKALAAGITMGLSDTYHRPKAPEISDDAKSWVVNLACTKPKDHGLAAELWTLSQLAKFIGGEAENAGFPRLAKASKTTVWRILDEHEIKPHRIRYYLERRDPDFDAKMREVLIVYQEVALQNAMPTKAAPDASESERPVITVSVDEKPGIQAIGTVAPDLPPVSGRHSETGRDYEYVRHGTLSILAALDLHTGHLFAEVEERHRSSEFIQLLKRLDNHYPANATIRVILDNHSAHISKETMAYLATRPGRFEYVHTPKHGSWLNLIEMAFSKMARSFLRHIRVTSKQELKERILKGITEFNDQPVVFRWKSFDLGLV
jgi:transposase